MKYSYWGLKGSPFGFGLDPKGFFLSGVHEEALARLEFLVHQRRRLGVLIGPAGCGKSLLLEVFAEKLRRAGQPVARICPAGAQCAELLCDLLIALGRLPKPRNPVSSLWQQVGDRLREACLIGQSVVILCDQMESATQDIWQTINRLLGYIDRPECAATVVLAGRSQMLRLGHELLSKIDLPIQLEPWELLDTQQYLQEALRRAGRIEPIFTPEGVQRLHELSGGIPRQINRLAELALLAGALEGFSQIGPEIIEALYPQLSLDLTAAGAINTMWTADNMLTR
ncbi:MAG: AAA family ATPase [Thermoguttaceae bacterium]|nr:AAA family ATPase [Thermoguttaceae bacterium]MDW8038446.1 AAA family ATPase [Thermoguttaceae bacterium]